MCMPQAAVVHLRVDAVYRTFTDPIDKLFCFPAFLLPSTQVTLLSTQVKNGWRSGVLVLDL